LNLIDLRLILEIEIDWFWLVWMGELCDGRL